MFLFSHYSFIVVKIHVWVYVHTASRCVSHILSLPITQTVLTVLQASRIAATLTWWQSVKPMSLRQFQWFILRVLQFVTFIIHIHIVWSRLGF